MIKFVHTLEASDRSAMRSFILRNDCSEVFEKISNVFIFHLHFHFAATPPCEEFNMQLSLMMTGPRSQVEGDDDVLNISRTHLHSPLARAVFVTVDGKVYKLLKAMYGLRDAGEAFDGKVLDVMNLGKFSICVGYRKVMDTLVRLVRWGADFSLSGRRSLCNAFRDELGKHLLVKTTAVMGPDVENG